MFSWFKKREPVYIIDDSDLRDYQRDVQDIIQEQKPEMLSALINTDQLGRINTYVVHQFMNDEPAEQTALKIMRLKVIEE